MDIKEFEDNIWNIYKDFNKDVNDYYFYNIYSNNILYDSDDKENYRDICVKILRNLYSFYNNNYDNMCSSTECCKYLNYWMSYVKKKHNLSDKLLQATLVGASFYFSPNEPDSCLEYTLDEKYKEPEKIIKLLYFLDNISIIKNTLLHKNISMNCAGQSYIYECINIYSELDEKYCSKADEKNGVNKSVCEILDKFKTSYTEDFYNKAGIADKTPALSSYINIKDIVGCQEYIGKEKSFFDKGDNSGSSISYSVSTAVGTMAGASSILALLYKVTQSFI
ncbi:hypothetical protein PCYB_002930 [Plasmodium cynomolgi strain B]|uniref:CYIR protein n=1 Tax=Plasmodium cynomolgi (strain B) TaxID=1120755 RepID=K6UZX5_PLACD|nr:hypothetical protein PCYB_002930 [Plasmodium cynomolgi strain B]GAB69544.1 hypothetical protein PCYB_002930 [Plasmodium cynomolgi strain B]